MIPALVEWMLPELSELAQFTGCVAAQNERPADAPHVGGATFLEGTFMGELSQRIIAKVSGPAWDQIRGQFMQIARSLLAVAPRADSELFTTYVKFTVQTAPESRVFAAIWLKNSKRLIVGLSLPEEYEAEELGPALPGTMYKGFHKYFVVERGSAVPKGLAEWAAIAYQTALSARPTTAFAVRERLPRAA